MKGIFINNSFSNRTWMKLSIASSSPFCRRHPEPVIPMSFCPLMPTFPHATIVRPPSFVLRPPPICHFNICRQAVVSECWMSKLYRFAFIPPISFASINPNVSWMRNFPYELLLYYWYRQIKPNLFLNFWFSLGVRRFQQLYWCFVCLSLTNRNFIL